MPVLGLFVALHGIAVGTEVAVTPVLALRVVGEARFATLYGLLQLVSTIAIGLAPVIPGLFFDATGSYSGAVLFWIVTMLVGVGVAFAMHPPARRGVAAHPPRPERVPTHDGRHNDPGAGRRRSRGPLGARPKGGLAVAKTQGAWADAYRRKWTWDRVSWGSHSVDCYPGGCPRRVYMKDGKVVREEQAGDLRADRGGRPRHEPDGLPEGRVLERICSPLPIA